MIDAWDQREAENRSVQLVELWGCHAHVLDAMTSKYLGLVTKNSKPSPGGPGEGGGKRYVYSTTKGIHRTCSCGRRVVYYTILYSRVYVSMAHAVTYLLLAAKVGR